MTRFFSNDRFGLICKELLLMGSLERAGEKEGDDDKVVFSVRFGMCASILGLPLGCYKKKSEVCI